MTRSLLGLAIFLSCTPFGRAQFPRGEFSISVTGTITVYSYTFDKAYKTTITREALRVSPAWKDDAENPPLSAKKAKRLADDTRLKLVKAPANYKWELESLELKPTFVEER
jgi:hypothetical protein